jgi:methyl-accepting chemotaxis protein
MKTKIILVSTAAVLLIALFTVFYSRSAFTREVTALNYRDYSERIRNIEWDYDSVDVVSGATEAAERAQQEILEKLHDRYVNVEQIRSYPLIFNGDGEKILYIERSNVPADFVQSEHARQIMKRKNGDFSFTYDGSGYYAVFSYYEPWDWYTVYLSLDSERLAAVNHFTVRLSAGLAVVTALLLGLLFFFMNRTINPLLRLRDAIEHMRSGDLSRRFKEHNRDEVGAIAASFNELGDTFSGIVTRIKSSTDAARSIERELQMKGENTLQVLERISDQTGSSSGEIKDLDEKIKVFSDHVARIGEAMENLGEQVDQEVQAVKQTSSAIEQSNESLRSMSQLTEEKREVVRSLQETAERGGNQQQSSDRSIQEILSRVDNVSETVTIIQDIADRTNLLAMNAAIEAAHAGESGRGFAVVAEEIRALAAQSTENAANIEKIVKDIIERIHNASSLSSTASESFREIQSRVDEVGTAFEEIARYTAGLTDSSGEISQALETLDSLSGQLKEQSGETTRRSAEASRLIDEVQGISSRMREAIEHIDSTSQKSAEWMKELFELTDNLRQSMDRLSTAVSSFTTPDETQAEPEGEEERHSASTTEQAPDSSRTQRPAVSGNHSGRLSPERAGPEATGPAAEPQADEPADEMESVDEEQESAREETGVTETKQRS